MPDSCHSGRSGTGWHFMAITWKYSSVSLFGIHPGARQMAASV